MSDADLDARVQALSDEDVQAIADDTNWPTGNVASLTWFRPGPLRVRMAEEILRLRAEVAKWKPLTHEEAQAAYDAAEAMPFSAEEIERVVAFATDPANRLPNDQQSLLVAEVRRCQKYVAEMEEEKEALESSLGDEEAAHQETLQLWQAAKAEANLYYRGYELIGAADISNYLAKCEQARNIDDLEAENEKLRQECLRLSMQTPEDRELDIANGASSYIADKLLEIAEQGRGTGVFGGRVEEAAAQAILRLRQDNARLLEAARYLMVCLWGAADRGGWAREDILALAQECVRRWPELEPGK